MHSVLDGLAIAQLWACKLVIAGQVMESHSAIINGGAHRQSGFEISYLLNGFPIGQLWMRPLMIKGKAV